MESQSDSHTGSKRWWVGGSLMTRVEHALKGGRRRVKEEEDHCIQVNH